MEPNVLLSYSQSTCHTEPVEPHPFTLRCVLIISSYARLLRTGLVRSVLAINVYMYFLSPQCVYKNKKRWMPYTKVTCDYKIYRTCSGNILGHIRCMCVTFRSVTTTINEIFTKNRPLLNIKQIPNKKHEDTFVKRLK